MNDVTRSQKHLEGLILKSNEKQDLLMKDIEERENYAMKEVEEARIEVETFRSTLAEQVSLGVKEARYEIELCRCQNVENSRNMVLTLIIVDGKESLRLNFITAALKSTRVSLKQHADHQAQLHRLLNFLLQILHKPLRCCISAAWSRKCATCALRASLSLSSPSSCALLTSTLYIFLSYSYETYNATWVEAHGSSLGGRKKRRLQRFPHYLLPSFLLQLQFGLPGGSLASQE